MHDMTGARLFFGHNGHINPSDHKGIFMITEVSAVNFRQNLGDMLGRVQYRNDSIIINKDGKPVAALVDAELFARIRRMQARFEALSRKLRNDYADVPEADGLAEIDATVAALRATRG